MSSLILKIDGNSIMEQLVRGIATAYDTLTIASKVVDENDDPPTWMFGRTSVDMNFGPPSVVWVPTSGSIGGPGNAGGGFADGATVQRDRSLYDRILGFDVYCNGRTYEEAEKLLSSVVVAAREALGVDSMPTAETWVTEQDSTADTALNKVEVMISFDIRIPITDRERGLTVVTAQTHTETLIALAC